MLQTIFGAGRTNRSRPRLQTLSFSKLKRHWVYIIPVCSVIACILLLDFLINPYIKTQQTRAKDAIITEFKTGITGSKASLIIEGTDVSESVDRVNSVYLSKKVTFNATRINSYQITISSAQPTLKMEDTEDSEQATESLDNQIKWGYYYGEESDTSKVSYAPFSEVAAEIDSGKPKSYKVDNLTNNLLMEASFGQDVEEGTYETEVFLNLTITPRDIVGTLWRKNLDTEEDSIDSGIEYMQEIDQAITDGGFCGDAIPVGYSIYLKDIRGGGYDNSTDDELTYMIMKLADNRCWMVQNLKLDLVSKNGDPVTLNSATTDVPAGWTWQNGGTGGTNAVLVRRYPLDDAKWVSTGTYDSTVNHIGYSVEPSGNYKNLYGYYYSWCAAVANSCQSGNASIPSGAMADSSICPKGWELPKSATDFNKAFNASSYDNKVASWQEGNLPGILVKIGDSSEVSLPAAGRMNGVGGFSDGGTEGCYWTRISYTYNNSVPYAESARFNKTSWIFVNKNIRSLGYNVRCVAGG